MSKYIDAEELLKRLNVCKYPAKKATMRQVTYNAAISDACRSVDAMPAADVQEVRHGRWEKKNVPTDFDGEVFNVEHIVCSVCEAAIPLNRIYKREWYSDYCPSCGAKMDEKESPDLPQEAYYNKGLLRWEIKDEVEE